MQIISYNFLLSQYRHTIGIFPQILCLENMEENKCLQMVFKILNTYNEGLLLRKNCIVLFIRASRWSPVASLDKISEDFIKQTFST